MDSPVTPPQLAVATASVSVAPASGAAVPAATTAFAVPMPAPEPKLTLAKLFEAEESGLLRFALGLGGRRSIAEELVQETFLRLHQIWSQVENPRAWLYRSVRNLLHDQVTEGPSPAIRRRWDELVRSEAEFRQRQEVSAATRVAAHRAP